MGTFRTSKANNHIEMKAAASTTLKVTNTVKLRMTVANQERENGTMTKRVLEVTAMVVPNLSRPFILSNKDLSSFDACKSKLKDSETMSNIIQTLPVDLLGWSVKDC